MRERVHLSAAARLRRPSARALPVIRTGAGPRLRSAVRAGLVAAGVASLLALGAVGSGLLANAGPPFPQPTQGQHVYDTAGVFSAATIAQAETVIGAVEARTGAQIAVYAQVKPESSTPALALADARALMDQWGVGRRGFDDGLVILFDLDRTLRHGQVQLYAGSGFRASFLGDGERQAIFEEDMLPALRRGDLDGALLVALDRVDEAATPEHAAALTRARQLNGVVGVVGLLLGLLLVAYWGFHWLRFGRDPTYLDDPSILMPAPPPDLTPALGALVYDGRSGRHTLTTGLVDLAGRGELRFEAADRGRVAVVLPEPAPARPDRAPEQGRPPARAERAILQALRELGRDGGGYVSPDALQKLSGQLRAFDAQLEGSAVAAGWFSAEPGAVIRRWALLGAAEVVVGVAGLAAGGALPSSGAAIAGGSVATAGLVTIVGAWAMPARTMAGAMIRAMLAAYRRTLHHTLAQARSLERVAVEAALPWIETPDQALVWGVALGLQREVETVLQRSIQDLRSGAATDAWLPGWYLAGQTAGGPGVASGTLAPSGLAPGLLAASAVPDLGGMFAAIGSIGAGTSSGGSGGFGGGGSAGGGGAGGGF